jgi:hypothetical protein
MTEAAELQTVEVQAIKENPDVYGGEEPHQMLVWADSDSWDEHPYWVIDFLEAGGWAKHFPELGYDEESEPFVVHYNSEERNDIRKLVKPDGEEITADER